MKTAFVIQQYTGRQYEPVPEGEFETADAAIAGMRALESDLGWRDLRVVVDAGARFDLSGRRLIGDDAHEAIEYGLDDDNDDSDDE